MAKNAFLFAETTEKTAYRDSKNQPAAAVPQLEPHKCPWHCPKWVQGQPGPQKQTACVSSLLTASSEVKTQPQSLADWHSGAQSQTGQQCPRCWPREKATTCPSTEGTPELLFLHPQGYTGWISFPHYDRQLAWHTNIQSVPQVSKNASVPL